MTVVITLTLTLTLNIGVAKALDGLLGLAYIAAKGEREREGDVNRKNKIDAVLATIVHHLSLLVSKDQGISLSLSLSLALSLSLPLSLSLSLSLSVSLSQSLSLSLPLSPSLSLSLSIYLTISLSLSLSKGLMVRLWLVSRLKDYSLHRRASQGQGPLQPPPPVCY
jgi:hypothetical protein